MVEQDGIVMTEGVPVARLGDVAVMPKPGDQGPILEGSATVFANGRPIAGFAHAAQGLKGAHGKLAMVTCSSTVFMDMQTTSVPAPKVEPGGASGSISAGPQVGKGEAGFGVGAKGSYETQKVGGAIGAKVEGGVEGGAKASLKNPLHQNVEAKGGVKVAATGLKSDELGVDAGAKAALEPGKVVVGAYVMGKIDGTLGNGDVVGVGGGPALGGGWDVGAKEDVITGDREYSAQVILGLGSVELSYTRKNQGPPPVFDVESVIRAG
jgi:uncharacterized Zn-binding protein involved in type VI secretion